MLCPMLLGKMPLSGRTQMRTCFVPLTLKVVRFGGTYHPMSSSDLKSLVIVGMAVDRIVYTKSLRDSPAHWTGDLPCLEMPINVSCGIQKSS